MDKQQSDSRATTIFVVGLLSIFLCQLLGPVAWIMGNGYQRDCILDGVEPNQLGTIGKILGMVGTALFVFSLVITVVVVVLEIGVVVAMNS